VNELLEQFPMTCDPALKTILLDYLQSIDVHDWPGIDGLTLDAVLDCYCVAIAAGHVPDKEKLLRRHPELAQAIEAFFAARGGTQRAESLPNLLPPYHEHTD